MALFRQLSHSYYVCVYVHAVLLSKLDVTFIASYYVSVFLRSHFEACSAPSKALLL